jgi:two-component system response regulator HydG
MESELFGHERGAFTGAVTAQPGRFEQADGGTRQIPIDVRVITGSKRDLRQMVAEGKFRDDLFYRLNVIGIHIPPLRERIEDVPLLAQEFVDRLAHELGREVSGISEEALRLLMDHAWPGNVRELENAVERALVTCKSGVLGASDFAFLSRTAGAPGGDASLPPGLTLQEMEKDYIAATLGRLQGNVKAAAEALGIDRSTLYEKIKRYEIPR